MKAQVAAEQLLRDHDLSQPPVPVDDLAAELGTRVVYEELENSVSGMLFRSTGNLPAIVVNSRHARVRQRFTIGHELGHYLLHRGRPVIVDHLTRARVNLRDSTSSLATSREEIAANQFAATLLMPTDWVHRYVDERLAYSPTKLTRLLAEEFDVSDQAMEYRLINLGIRAAP